MFSFRVGNCSRAATNFLYVAAIYYSSLSIKTAPLLCIPTYIKNSNLSKKNPRTTKKKNVVMEMI